MSNPTDHTDLDETEDEEDEVDEDEDEEDTEPCCPECDTPLKEYTHVGGGYDGFGYGCPSCFMQFCPFCRKAFSEECSCLQGCSHLVFVRSSEDDETDQSLFDNGAQLIEAMDKFLARVKEVGEGAWSATQQKQAFGSQLPIFEAVQAELNLEGSDTPEALEALCKAIPPTAGVKLMPFRWENTMGMGYSEMSGFYTEKPEEARRYYTEQAEKFIPGLIALAAIEPEVETEK